MVDDLGLSDPFVARVALEGRKGIVGHEKHQPLWAMAAYVNKAGPGLAARVNLKAGQVLSTAALSEAWAAEHCGGLGVVARDVNGAWGWSRAFGDFLDAPANTWLRFNADPKVAVKDLCRPGS